MKRSLPLFIFFFSYVIGMNNIAVAINANPKNSSPHIEKFYKQIGYKTVEEAVLDFEKHFNMDVTLPFKIPPIPFTHYFGRFNDLEGEINDSLDIEFINEHSPENHYKIDIRPAKTKISFNDNDVSKRLTLQNGNDAIFINIPGFYVLVFSINNWQYMLSVDKRNSEKSTPEVLVEIANSIDYKSEW